MQKTANVTARIEPTVKEQAEAILSSLGIPASNAINIFYKQIILQRGLPFEIKLPDNPLDMNKMTDAKFSSILDKGMSEAENGRTISAQEAFEQFERVNSL